MSEVRAAKLQIAETQQQQAFQQQQQQQRALGQYEEEDSMLSESAETGPTDACCAAPKSKFFAASRWQRWTFLKCTVHSFDTDIVDLT